VLKSFFLIYDTNTSEEALCLALKLFLIKLSDLSCYKLYILILFIILINY